MRWAARLTEPSSQAATKASRAPKSSMEAKLTHADPAWPGRPGPMAIRSVHQHGARGARSEERRVGKECRSLWAPDHLKKKEERVLSWRNLQVGTTLLGRFMLAYHSA